MENQLEILKKDLESKKHDAKHYIENYETLAKVETGTGNYQYTELNKRIGDTLIMIKTDTKELYAKVNGSDKTYHSFYKDNIMLDKTCKKYYENGVIDY